ncbi:MAG: hypothetical protein ACJZ8C_03735, partial [Prochlorococcus marinus subsp. pastoris]
RLVHFSLAKTFLQSYQGIWAIFKAWRTCYPNFFGYKLIIHQRTYLGKLWVVWGQLSLHMRIYSTS